MQSTALALMACENANMNKPVLHGSVPIYDAVIFCDLGLEPPWVARQVEFTRCACERAGIPFYVLDTPLYKDFMTNFGQRRTISVPWWTLKEDGHKSKMPRNCTIDYKIEAISKFVRWELLGYRKGQRLRPEDVKAHEMHMGFSAEEKQRCKENPNRLFVNRFPLVEMGLTRADNYKYILEEWGLDTKASACAFCPFHRNYFFQYIKEHELDLVFEIIKYKLSLFEMKRVHPDSQGAGAGGTESGEPAPRRPVAGSGDCTHPAPGEKAGRGAGAAPSPLPGVREHLRDIPAGVPNGDSV